MSKVKIAITSALKPLKDSRHFERFALSLAKANKYEINIIAIDQKKQKDDDNVIFHPIGQHPGKSLVQRLKLQYKAFKTIRKLKPDLLIICSVELLPYIAWYRSMNRCVIIYDIQENYRLNFQYLQEYTWLAKWLFRPIVQLMESSTNLFVDHYFLAERCYADQLHFIKNRYTVLENKTVRYVPEKSRKQWLKNEKIRILFSGTISYYAGMDRVLYLVEILRRKNVNFQLTIIGQVHDQQLSKALYSISGKDVITIIGSAPIDHDTILEQIQQADLGLITYEPNLVNRYKIPTKLFEYTTYQLPYLIQRDTEWAVVGEEMGGAIPVNFVDPDIEAIQKSLSLASSSFHKPNRSNAEWTTEEQLLLNTINALIN